jgi:hypothetical protein
LAVLLWDSENTGRITQKILSAGDGSLMKYSFSMPVNLIRKCSA